MKTNFTKVAMAVMAAGMAFGSASAEMIGNVEFPGFVKHIEEPLPTKESNSRELPESPMTALKKAARKAPSRFVGWNAENPSMPNLVAKSAEVGEKMDSVVGVWHDGSLMSKQEFSFTENGLPLLCRNFLPTPEGTDYRYVGHFEYEYDELYRLISAEQLDLEYAGSCQRMEYGYNGNSPQYNLQIAYLMGEDGDWMPFQKAEYEFDVNGNTTKETYYSWSEDINNWVPVRQVEATYDEMSRMTTYFPYVWDTELSSWVGDSGGAFGGQRFEYNQAGQDAEKGEYLWLDGQWVEYHKKLYTYNDAALRVRLDLLYWNREKQDWSGAETWGRWENMYYNEYQTYDYDEYGRQVELNVFTSKSGEYVNNYRAVTSYELLESGETERIGMKGYVNADDSYEPYSKTLQRFNQFGSETYYISHSLQNGEWVPNQEQIRYYMEGYHWYLGCEAYNYFNGERKPDSKEWFTYPEDFNPSLPYETPIEGRHWIGKGTPDWHLKQVDNFTWGPRDVMIGYVSYDYLQSEGNKTTGWENEFDFAADTSNIFLWPKTNNAAYLENKMLKSIEYNNPQYWNGNDEWMPEYSYTFTYYYSPRTSTGIDAAELPNGVVEVERYDLMGRRLAEPTTGINIVRYSDGSSRKVMVK